MPDDDPLFNTLTRAELAFALSRAFVKRRGRTKHKQAVLTSTLDIVAAEAVADALIADGYRLLREVEKGCNGQRSHGDPWLGIEHPAD